MAKNNKTTLERLEALVNVVARNVADIKSEMTTKKDLEMFATKFDLENVEHKLISAIEKVKDNVDALEEIDIRTLQNKVFNLEKDFKAYKRKNV